MVSRVTGLPGVTPTVPSPAPPTILYKPPKATIELPPGLNRPPRATDLIIKKGFDGLSPDRAVTRIRNKLTNTLAPQNRKLVEDTARRAHRDFNVALNNVFTPGSPNHRFLSQFAGRQVSVLGTMSTLNPVVYKVEGRGLEPTRFYSRDFSGNFAELQRPPTQVVIEAKVRLTPPGVAVEFPAWTNKALSQKQLTTIEEL
ncbi:MAG: hypothetical protein AB1938_22500 [Myxococcota bacterium]